MAPHIIDPIKITDDNFRNYGNIFTDFEEEEVRIEKWPKHKKGFRTVHDGVGGGTTSGHFHVLWENGKIYSCNNGVANGEYSFANLDKNEDVIVTNEINYHACGSQAFICYTHDMYLMLAYIPENDHRFPDFIRPTDFVCFKVPKGVGANINSYIWHCPPIVLPSNNDIIVYTKQASVHSKIYYDPDEDNTVFKIKIDKN